MNVDAVMTKNPKTCRPTETLHRAAQLMWEVDCGVVPIVDEVGKLVGVVTDRDVCMAAYTNGAPLHTLPIERTMARDVYAVSLDASVAEVANLMATVQVRRLPVLDQGGVLVGIVSLSDLVQRAFGELVPKKKRVKADTVAVALAGVSRPRPRAATDVDNSVLVPAKRKRAEAKAEEKAPVVAKRAAPKAVKRRR